jgi:hypothetical protein
MRKSFTRLFGFLLLNVMMLFTFGLYAQEQQSTVELKAPTVDQCYNATNSYTAAVTVRDFIAMKSFRLTLSYDKSEFGVTSVTPVTDLGGTFTSTVDAVTGKITVEWSNSTAVTLGDNAYANLFTVVFNVLNFPNNIGDNLFDSVLTWVSPSNFYYGENFTGTYQVSTTAFTNGSLNVPVSYTSVQYTVTPASCSGGQALITITSPVGTGLEYYFNGSTTSSTTPSATADAPSTNYVRIKDANGCYSHLFTIPVTAPELLKLNSVSTEDAKCHGDNGEIQIDATGGVGPYTYYVVPDADMAYFQSQIAYIAPWDLTSLNKYRYTNFQVLKPAGTYWVNVVDANHCNSLRIGSGNPANPTWVTVQIGEPGAITFATPVVTNNLCNGAADGTITVDGSTITGGTATYTVSINNSTWFTLGTTATKTFSSLSAGTYTVTVKDYNGCSTSTAVNVTQPNAMAFTLTYQDVACGGTVTPTGSITITGVTGGTASYTFAVAVAGTVTSTSGPSTGWVDAPGTIGSLAAGYYSIWVKDAGGCVKPFANQDGTGNKLPIQTPTALAVTTSADNVATKEVTCNGSTYTLTVTASGGTAPYVYSYNGGATTTSTAYAMGSVSTDTQVTVVVRDASGCTLTSVVTVNVPTPVVASLYDYGDGNIYLPPTCPGGNDGRVKVSASGGTSPYMYSTDQVIWYSNPVLAVPEGITNIYVRDARLCTSNTLVVDVTALTASTLTATTTEIACHGEKTGTISVTTTWQASRTVKYYVAAAAADVFTSGTAFTPASINGGAQTTPTTFVAGTYYLGAKDEYGCMSNVIMVQVKEKPALQLLPAPVITNASCFGLNDGTITINTTGGNGWPKYQIVNNPEALSNPDLLFLPLDTYSATTTIGKQVVQVQRGTYYIALKDDCDNVVTAGPYTVNGYKAIAFTGTVAKTNITCHDANNGTITVPRDKVSGGKPEFDGAGDYTFTLYKPTGGTVTNTTGAFANLAGGTYSITIKDASGCTSSSTITNIVITNPNAVAISAVSVTHFTCKDSRDGRIAITATGGTPGFWLAVNAVTPGTPITADNANWISFGSTTNTTQTKTYIATEPGVYYLYVKDANGCIGNTVSVTVLEPAILVPTVGTQTNVTCAGGADGQFQINVTGGWTPTQTYSFKRSGPTSGNTNATGVFTGLATGTYTVDVNITNVPSSSTSGIVTYNYATASPTTACSYRTSVTITEPAVYSYMAATTNVICKGESNGTLKVTVLGGSAATTTTIGDEYYVQLTTTANPTLGTGSAWKLTTGKMYTFTGLPHGIYSVWISNKNDGTGCLIPSGTDTPTADGVWKKSASWEVNEPATALTASVTWNNDVKCYGGNDGKFTVTAAGGVGGYKYAAKLSQLPAHVLVASELAAGDWQDSPVFASATKGTWIIWAKDANGCIVGGEGNGTPVDEWRVLVSEPNQVNFTPSVTANVSCFGANDGKITLGSITSAGQPFTYVLTGTDYAGNTVTITGTSTSTSPVISGVPANKTLPSSATNKYKVNLTDKNGCSREITLSAQVTQNKVLTVDIVKADGAFVCPGDNNGNIEAVAAGGSGTYTYRLWRDGSAYTSWVNLPSFLVEVGHTWAVEVKDANGCTATDSELIIAPDPVVATYKETTCYNDPKASVIVSATGQQGRQFAVRYRLNTTATYGAWSSYFAGSIAIGNLEFANVTETENFYYFQVKDDKGCMTEEIKKAFVPTQHPLQATLTKTDDLNGSVTITGGISPYTYQIGTAAAVTLPAAGDVFQVVSLKAGQTTITVTDAHGCLVAQSVTVSPVTVTAVPASGNNQVNAFDVKLTFNRDVTGVASATTVTSGTATSTFTVTGTGKVYTVSIKADDLATVVLTLGNTISDAASNTLTTTTFTYKIGDHVAPTVIVTPPATPVATVFNIGLKFSEPVSGVLAGTGVTVSGGKIEDITGMGSTYTVTVSAKEQTAVAITLTDVIADLSANVNKFAGQTLSYTTGDFTKPQLVSFTPSNDETTTDNHPTFTMTFDENVVLGTGSLKVYKVATTTPALIVPVTAAMVNGKVVTVTYAPTQQGLDKNARYYVLVDAGALKDNAGNTFDGVVDAAAWTFKTGNKFVTITDPVNGSLKVYPNPFVDYVNVVTTSQLSKVVVTNIAGQIVKEVVNPTNTIQLSGLRSGVYFISMYERDSVIGTAKIVKR